MQPFTGKIALEEGAADPLCPWCETPLARIHWHKIRGGPLLHYVAVLSCAACRGVLDVLEGGGGNGGAGGVV